MDADPPFSTVPDHSIADSACEPSGLKFAIALSRVTLRGRDAWLDVLREDVASDCSVGTMPVWHSDRFLVSSIKLRYVNGKYELPAGRFREGIQAASGDTVDEMIESCIRLAGKLAGPRVRDWGAPSESSGCLWRAFPGEAPLVVLYECFQALDVLNCNVGSADLAEISVSRVERTSGHSSSRVEIRCPNDASLILLCDCPGEWLIRDNALPLFVQRVLALLVSNNPAMAPLGHSNAWPLMSRCPSCSRPIVINPR